MRLRLAQLGGLAVIALTLCVQPVWAAGYKIGIVDLQKAASTSPQAEAARKAIDGKFRKRDRQLISAQKAIRKMEENLVKNRDVISEEQLARKNRDLRRERREFQRKLGEFNEDRNVANNEDLRKLQNQVIQVTQRLAKKDKFDLILIRGVVVFADEGRMDITSRVVELLKRDFKRGN